MDERLTSLHRVKDWLGEEYGSTSDELISYLIESVSLFILRYLNRSTFKPATYRERFKGSGNDYHIMKNWPIISITSVGRDGVQIPAAVLGDYGRIESRGYLLQEDQEGTRQINLTGYTFPRGAFIEVVYEAGYRKSYTGVVPADPFQVDLSTEWTGNISVTIGGVEATEVSTISAAGQYSVDEWGIYTFHTDDAGSVLVIEYSYAPDDVSFAATQLVGEWMKKKEHIGVSAKTLARQETIKYTDDMPKSVQRILQPYMRVTPN